MIGLDIGTYQTKLCRVEKRENGYHIAAAVMGRNPVAPEGSKEGGDMGPRIRDLFKEMAGQTTKVASSLGSSVVISRNFVFPKLSYQELKGAVQFEAGQSASLDISSLYSDFVILTPDSSEKLDVLFVAVPKDEIDKRIQVIQNAGLDPVVMDINSLALANSFWAFDQNPAKESVVLLDIGHTNTNMAIIDNEELRFIRSVDRGGKEITQEISDYLGVLPAQAEIIKKRPELWPEMGLNIKNVLRKSMPDLLEVVYRAMEYCMSRKKLASIDKILLTGGTSSLHGLEGFFAETLGVHTEKWNPLMNMDMDSSARKEYGQFLSVALGLAIRNEKNT